MQFGEILIRKHPQIIGAGHTVAGACFEQLVMSAGPSGGYAGGGGGGPITLILAKSLRLIIGIIM